MEGKEQVRQLRGMTVGEMKQLHRGDYLHDTRHVKKDGRCAAYKVTGEPYIWKTMPDRVRVPAHFGARVRDHIQYTASDADYLHRSEDCLIVTLYFERVEPGHYIFDVIQGDKPVAAGRLIDQVQLELARRHDRWAWTAVDHETNTTVSQGNRVKMAVAKEDIAREMVERYNRAAK